MPFITWKWNLSRPFQSFLLKMPQYVNIQLISFLQLQIAPTAFISSFVDCSVQSHSHHIFLSCHTYVTTAASLDATAEPCIHELTETNHILLLCWPSMQQQPEKSGCGGYALVVHEPFIKPLDNVKIVEGQK